MKQKIVIVEIDDRAVNELARWPWHRDAIAVLVLQAVDAGAKVVGLDIVFPEPDQRVPDGVVELLKAQRSRRQVPAVRDRSHAPAHHRSVQGQARARLDDRRVVPTRAYRHGVLPGNDPDERRCPRGSTSSRIKRSTTARPFDAAHTRARVGAEPRRQPPGLRGVRRSTPATSSTPPRSPTTSCGARRW